MKNGFVVIGLLLVLSQLSVHGSVGLGSLNLGLKDKVTAIGGFVGDTGKKVGGFVCDAGKAVGGFVGDTGKIVGGAGKTAGHFVVDTGKQAGGLAVDAGKFVAGSTYGAMLFVGDKASGAWVSTKDTYSEFSHASLRDKVIMMSISPAAAAVTALSVILIYKELYLRDQVPVSVKIGTLNYSDDKKEDLAFTVVPEPDSPVDEPGVWARLYRMVFGGMAD